MSTELPPHSDHLVVLGPSLSIDLEAGLILRPGVQIPLSARQVRLLTQLDHARRNTRGFLTAQALIPSLGPTQASDPDHCVEQAVSELRKKLGEVSGHPTILRGRRGFGYRLYPEFLCSTEEALSEQAIPSPRDPESIKDCEGRDNIHNTQ